MRRAGRVFRTPGLHHALPAFRGALSAHSECPRRRSIVEGRKLALEPGQLTLLPAVLTVSVIIVVLIGFPGFALSLCGKINNKITDLHTNIFVFYFTISRVV